MLLPKYAALTEMAIDMRTEGTTNTSTELTGEYGAVSHYRRPRDGQYSRFGRILGLAGCVVAAGVLLAAAGQPRSYRSSFLIQTAPKSGPGPHGLPDVNGILEDTIKGDPELDDEYEQSEGKLLGKIEAKLQNNVESDVDSEVQERLKEIKQKEASQKLATLVDRISTQMGAVTSGLNSIEELKAKQRKMINSINELEKEVSSNDSRELFIRAAAWLLQANETECNETSADCANATGDATIAEEEGPEEEAEEAAAEAEPASENIVNPAGATRLHITRKAPTVKAEAHQSIKGEMTSMEAEQKDALARMMAKWSRELHKDEASAVRLHRPSNSPEMRI